MSIGPSQESKFVWGFKVTCTPVVSNPSGDYYWLVVVGAMGQIPTRFENPEEAYEYVRVALQLNWNPVKVSPEKIRGVI